MNEPTSEGPPKPENLYKIVNPHPYDPHNIFFHVLAGHGYPLRFEERPGNHGENRLFVRIPNDMAEEKIQALEEKVLVEKLWKDTKYCSIIARRFIGVDDMVHFRYSAGAELERGSSRDVRYGGYFLVMYDEYYKKCVQLFGEEKAEEYLKNRELTQLYEILEENHVRPITPEEVASRMDIALQEVLDEVPGLQPQTI